MSVKWTSGHSESGILRKNEFKDKKEELFVFGYSCKLFRDDDKALHIDQGKHLIPWMGDETLKIDRYDARGALHDLGVHEAPPGGFDWRVELTRTELDVEQLCDVERYRALHTDEDEEEMYKEEELKRLHAAGYGQVGFNYDTPTQPEPVTPPVEIDEPFVPVPAFKALLPSNIILPETDKQNVIIEKTAKFIAEKGVQVEILIKAKQGDNPQFQFLNRDSTLHPYYTALIALVKAGKWPEKQPEVVEEKPHENEEYLHPSLTYSTIIESAPSIPSIQYRPSADCDYSLLVSRLRTAGAAGGGAAGGADTEGEEPQRLAPGEVAPPGTEPLPPRPHPHIQRAPVLYSKTEPAPEATHTHVTPAQNQQYATYYQQPVAPSQPPPSHNTEPKAPLKSTGLSLMKNYNTDSDSDVSDCDDTSSTDSKGPAIPKPPEEVQVVVDKMAAYVARNGAEFADIVRAKGDPRFSFLEPSDVHHAYYCARLAQLRNEKPKAPVSFSIKKLKEPDPILPRPALPYESSSDEESDKADKQSDKLVEKDENVVVMNTPTVPANNIVIQQPPIVVYKMEGTKENNIPVIKSIETIKPIQTNVTPTVTPEIINAVEEKPVKTNFVQEKSPPKKIEEVIKKVEVKKSATPDKVEQRRRESPRTVPDRKERDRKYEKSENRARRSRERERKREEREAKKKHIKDDLETEIISLEDNSDEMIDLTEDNTDSKPEVAAGAGGGAESEWERQKQAERRRRAAEFLRRVGVDPGAAAALPTHSLASAMVDTLESLRKKKAEAEEKRRKREKRRHRDRYGHEDDGDRSHRKSKRRKYKSTDEEDSDYDGSKKKKRKKDKKSAKSKKKRRKEIEEESEGEVDHALPPNIDLTTTLKELRTSSPTKDLVLQGAEDLPTLRKESSSEEDVKKKRKKDREYSEGEWSSDSEEDSGSSPSKNGD